MLLKGCTGEDYVVAERPLFSCRGFDLYAMKNGSPEVVKYYRSPIADTNIEGKVRFLKDHIPDEQMLLHVAWPIDLVYENGNFCGYIIKSAKTTDTLGSLLDDGCCSKVSYHQKILIGIGVCEVVESIHSAGYIVGDLNPYAIGVNVRTGSVVLYGADAFCVPRELTDRDAYGCSSCGTGYVAPEILNKCSDYIATHPENAEKVYGSVNRPVFSVETDNYALAIILFRLLMNGLHPFKCTTGVEVPSLLSPGEEDAKVLSNTFSFDDIGAVNNELFPPHNMLTDNAHRLFEEAFCEGKRDPKKRPNALVWKECLFDFEKQLTTCKNNSSHFYLRSLSSCPWCSINISKDEPIIRPPKKLLVPSSQEGADGTADTYSVANKKDNAIPTLPMPETSPSEVSKDGSAKGGIIGAVVIVLIALLVIVSKINTNNNVSDTDSTDSAEISNDVTYIDDDVYEDEQTLQGLLLNTTNLNVRSQPNTDCEIYTMLECGTLMNYIGYTDGWYEIEYSSGTAYVSGDYVVEVTYEDLDAERIGVVQATADVNIRSGPGSGYTRLGGLGMNQKAVFVGRSGDWYEIIIHEGQRAYISAAYATVNYDWR